MPATLDRLAEYSPGGRIYQSLKSEYGKAGADQVLVAYQSGEPDAVSQAIAQLKHGQPLNESTASIFADQIKTDPFAAPLASANKVIGTLTSSAVFGLFKNPFVLGALILFLVIRFPSLIDRFKALKK